jgi:hypothetical protein
MLRRRLSGAALLAAAVGVLGRQPLAAGASWRIVTEYPATTIPGEGISFFAQTGTWLSGGAPGLLTALTPLLLADATVGTGRYNRAQGLVATLSAASSAIAAEFVVGRFGYNSTFLGCALIAAVGLLVLWFGLPEPAIRASR